VEDVLRAVQESNVFRYTVIELKILTFAGALVTDRYVDSRVQESEFAQTLGENVVMERSGFQEDNRVRLKADLCAGLFGFTDNREFLGRDTLTEAHLMDFAILANFCLKPLGNGVDALGSHPVQATGNLVGAFAELSTCVEVGKHQFESRHIVLRVNVYRNAAPVILDGAGAIQVNGDFDVFAKPGESLVNGIVYDLKNAMVKAALVRVPDIHVGAFAHTL
jgi:hypothetical protein